MNKILLAAAAAAALGFAGHAMAADAEVIASQLLEAIELGKSLAIITDSAAPVAAPAATPATGEGDAAIDLLSPKLRAFVLDGDDLQFLDHRY